MGYVTVAELKTSISGKRYFRSSSSITHATECDLKIEIVASSFALHKFPLVSWSGRIRKLVVDTKDAKVSRINLSSVPGGPEAFELVAKFCYGIDVEITLSNVAVLRCVSHYLEMGEEFAEKNLEARTEAYLKDVVLPNISSTIAVLHHCENLLHISEEIKHLNRLINAIANNHAKNSSLLAYGNLITTFHQKLCQTRKWKRHPTGGECLWRSLISNFSSKDHHLVKGSLLELELQKKQRILVEAIVSLLPTQSRKSPIPMAFLSSLLKSSIASSVSTSCRLDLERQIGLQLDQAILEDILLPANSHGNNHAAISILKVSKFLDSYLAEVALDTNLSPSKFIALAELLPDHARIVSDGLYRAVDIFLKVHHNIKDSEGFQLCKTIDCQKLSQEACSHAAQNERLPVQMSVQVLYFEQIRLRNAMSGGPNQFFFGAIIGQFPQRSGSGAGSGAISPRDNYASVRRENRELKLEVAWMRMRLTDLEKDHMSMKQELVRTSNELLRYEHNRDTGLAPHLMQFAFDLLAILDLVELVYGGVFPEPTYESLDGMAHATTALAKDHHLPVCNHLCNHFH
ncbi:BTB/POZ domain-containing protein [Hibiscus syriacus]|uniref:BTB/POZ domain-containing protein n=1 Tax=Hibiscus syriacus TaxID=106335 RepID=A0A6A3BYZ2_HIBSY|nr:BTB/POZ domain-containing protein [Hibiscus syriacus]